MSPLVVLEKGAPPRMWRRERGDTLAALRDE
jgi:hypothetical protein